MMSTTISRAELQNMNPEVAKKKRIEEARARKVRTLEALAHYYKDKIVKAAQEGKTSYRLNSQEYTNIMMLDSTHEYFGSERYLAMVDTNFARDFIQKLDQQTFTKNFTIQEFANAVHKLFPDSDIKYMRVREECDPNVYHLVDYWTLDWS